MPTMRCVPAVRYELRTWADGYWHKVKTNLQTTTNQLDVPDMVVGQLYWLKQVNAGKEEMPFYIDTNGEQHFPQLPFLETLSKIKGL